MKKILNYIDDMKSTLETDRFKAILIRGASGLGKSCILADAYAILNNSLIVDIDFFISHSSYEEMLAEKLTNYCEIFGIVPPLQNKYMSSTEYIFVLINSLTKEHKLILSFSNLSYCTEMHLNFLSYLLKNIRILNNFKIVIDIDDDLVDNKCITKIISSTIMKQVKINAYDEDSMKEFFIESLYCCNLSVSDKDWEDLYKMSQGNLSLAYSIINILYEHDLIEINDDTAMIKPIPRHIFKASIESYVLQRFENLDDTEKSILAKSSCMGYMVDGMEVTKIFSVAKACEILKTIESTSKLINEIEANRFTFESHESCEIIKNTLSNKDKSSIVTNIADYYYSTLNNQLKRIDRVSYLQNLSIALEMYSSTENLDRLIDCYFLLIGNKEETNSYEEALNLCQECEKFCFNKDILPILKYRILFLSVKTEHYQMGLKYAQELMSSNSVMKYQIEYFYALCLYWVAETEKSMSTISNLIKKLENNENYVQSLLIAQSLRLLSALYDFIEDDDNQLLYFNKAIDLSKRCKFNDEYYSLLRQSGMVYPYEFADAMMREAEKYFKEKGNLIELAKVTHNIATDAMYSMKFEIAKVKCNESIEYFKKYGSHNISNPYNTLGILCAINEKNYEDSISYFDMLIEPDTWDLSVSKLNISTALRKLGKWDESIKLINEISSKDLRNMPMIKISSLICEALYYLDNGEKNKSIEACKNLIDCNLNLEYRHKYILNQILKACGINDTIEGEGVIKTNYINSLSKDYFDFCFKEHTYWLTTRFWEN